jgi:hypothetical protein
MLKICNMPVIQLGAGAAITTTIGMWGNGKLGDTPRPQAGKFMYLFFSRLDIFLKWKRSIYGTTTS